MLQWLYLISKNLTSSLLITSFMMALMTKFTTKVHVQDYKHSVSQKPAPVIHSLSPFGFARVGWRWNKIRIEESVNGMLHYNFEWHFLKHACHAWPSSSVGSAVEICCSRHPLVPPLGSLGLIAFNVDPHLQTCHQRWP